MAKIDTWLAKQLPDMQRSMKALSGIDFLHISTDQAIRKMRPRIGFRQMKVEDRTIPRICGAPHLLGCIYGHTAVHDSAINQYVHEHDVAPNWNGVFAVYRMAVPAVIKPSKWLVPDAPQTDELWLVPYSPELCEIVPTRVGTMLLHLCTETVVNGEASMRNVFYLKVDSAFKLYDRTLTPGFYTFELAGDLKAYGGKPMEPVTNLTTLSAGAWTEAMSMLRAAAKRRAEAN